MKYIRTENGIYNIKENGGIFTITKIYEATRYANGKLQQEGDRLVRIQGKDYKITNDNVADTIEELCDELVIKYDNEEKPRTVNMMALLISCNSLGLAFKKHIQWLYENYKDRLEICCLSIWVGAKLTPVAKMNDEGELELL